MSKQGDKRSLTEEIDVAGNQLVDRAKELIAEGNVRRLKVRKPDGGNLVDVPLTPAVAVGSVVTLVAPWFTILVVLGAMLARFRIEIVHIDASDDSGENDT